MAQYDVVMSCGHKDVVVLFGKTAERERKLEWYKHSGLCKECFKIQKREQEKEEGLVINAICLPYVDPDTGSLLAYVWFSGDTMPHKDEIKAIGGYHWEEPEGGMETTFMLKAPSKHWGKRVREEDFEEEMKKALTIGATYKEPNQSQFFALANAHLAHKKKELWHERQKEIDAIEKPEEPQLVKGKTWNRKLYGGANNPNIYLDGECVNISPEEADEIRAYISAIEAYKAKVDEIKTQYKEKPIY